MNISSWCPEELIPALTWLGKHDWLEPQMVPNSNNTIFGLDTPTLPPSLPNRQRLQLILDHGTPVDFVALYCVSKSLVLGPKLIRPTFDQCLAFEHVDLGVSFSDYQQPFPSVLVEFPSAYRHRLTKEFGVKCPRGVMCHHDEQSGYIFCVTDSTEGRETIVDVLPPRPQFLHIEEALNIPADEGNDIDQGRVLQRVALNLCLMLTMAGCRVVGPSDPKKLTKLKRRKAGNRKDRLRHLRLAKQKMPTLITFEQEVTFDLKRKLPETSGEQSSHLTSNLKKPHWRKGHFRMQRFGPGRSKSKLKFIPPVFVNRRLFHGNESDTKSVYRGMPQ